MPFGIGIGSGCGIGVGRGLGLGLGTGFFAADASAIWQKPLAVLTALRWRGKGGGNGIGIGVGIGWGIGQGIGMRSGDGIGLGMGFCIGIALGIGIAMGIGRGDDCKSKVGGVTSCLFAKSTRLRPAKSTLLSATLILSRASMVFVDRRLSYKISAKPSSCGAGSSTGTGTSDRQTTFWMSLAGKAQYSRPFSGKCPL